MDRYTHWQQVYLGKSEDRVSWFQPRAATSLALITQLGLPRDAPIIDVGGGASRLVDGLLDAGYSQVSVLDVAPAALAKAHARLGDRAARVGWIEGDVLEATMTGAFRLWHDRAVFHFLTLEHDRTRYLQRLERHLQSGGAWIVATFARDGPAQCSGLPVVRYEPDELDLVAGSSLRRIATRREVHVTPAGKVQTFYYCVYVRE
ncbi:MAG: class I SAM-dependent methyltransferase [Polyangiaceae bacterium]|jgi:ubiquinone/menaquinone biosynthesis C-methylase UbiE|nr:class I SAM-dependent methyltransferase [Polyangiaceae bacterium]